MINIASLELMQLKSLNILSIPSCWIKREEIGFFSIIPPFCSLLLLGAFLSTPNLPDSFCFYQQKHWEVIQWFLVT